MQCLSFLPGILSLRNLTSALPVFSQVVRIATGLFHCHALTETLQLYTWGVTPQSLKFKALLQKRKVPVVVNSLEEIVMRVFAGGSGGESCGE